uniref:Uncharacterized protein LOC102809633 n=1 Tax=Saccoglossus kowalevskii TaxID=10224 RepID=A0ABM0M3I9_SACKO|nr:PREDICTED: uncharacterized protein LOC102809633 [Saccoglossus kowalevskii]
MEATPHHNDIDILQPVSTDNDATEEHPLLRQFAEIVCDHPDSRHNNISLDSTPGLDVAHCLLSNSPSDSCTDNFGTVTNIASSVSPPHSHLPSISCVPTYILPYYYIREGVERCSLPIGWVYLADDECLQLSYIVKNATRQPEITKNISVYRDLNWSVAIHGEDCGKRNIFSHVPQVITGLSAVLDLLNTVNSATVCIGNPDSKFHPLADSRHGIFKSYGRNGKIVGKQQHVTIQNKAGTMFHSTIKAADCQLILEGNKERCDSCCKFRNTLYAMHCNDSKNTCEQNKSVKPGKTEHFSHVPLSQLSHNELYERTKNIIQAKRRVEKSGEAFKNLAENYESTIKEEFAEGTFQRLFWEQQVKALNCPDSRGMRWHPMFIKWCLNIKLRSSAAYRTLKESGVIHLPNERTLLDYTHWTNSGSGFSADVMEQLYRECSFEELAEHQKYVVLVHDELKIQADLVFEKSSGKLVGFVDINNFNNSLAMYEKNLDDGPVKPDIATYMLVFMVRGVCLHLNYPLAHFPTTSITSDFLFPLVWEAIEVLEMYDFKVMVSTSDGASPNRRFYKIHQSEDPEELITYRTPNHYADDGRFLYFMSDVPHLIKTTRNCWANSVSHNNKRLLWNGDHIVWKTLEDLYRADLERGGLFLCHKLKYEHIHLTSFSRMKVKYAAQVLSSTVANAVSLFGQKGPHIAPTVEFIRNFDKFFDCLNVRSMIEGVRKRKPNLMPYRSPDDPRLQLCFQFLDKDQNNVRHICTASLIVLIIYLSVTIYPLKEG